jgi:hypothetical protein
MNALPLDQFPTGELATFPSGVTSFDARRQGEALRRWPLLDRDEFRAHCDRYKTRSQILQHL